MFLPKKVIKVIQSMMAKFLWKGSITGSCYYKISWQQCCLRKTEGGLGFKELLGWNQSAVCLQVWRIINYKEDSLWVHWFHKFLLRNKAFWTMAVPTHCSWGVRKIFKARELVLSHVTYRVGRDSNLLLWHDPWGVSGPVYNSLGHRAISSLQSTFLARVNSIIRDGQWSLGPSNDSAVLDLRQICAHTTIHSNDSILWDGVEYKHLKVSDIWDVFRPSGSLPSWFHFVWCKFQVPKYSFNAWLIVQERLLTKDRMNNFHMYVDPICLLCGIENESHSHLFCTCTYVRRIYASWPLGITLDWNEMKAGNIFSTTGFSQVEKEMTYLYTTAVMHAVWRERNMRLHDLNHNRGVPSVLGEIKEAVRDKLSTCKNFIQCVKSDVSLISWIY